MNRNAKAKNSFLIFSSIVSVQSHVGWLIGAAERALSERRTGILEDTIAQLEQLPLPVKYEAAIRYYNACNQLYRHNSPQAKKILEDVAEHGPMAYRVRAVMSLGAIDFRNGAFDSALSIFAEGAKMTSEFKSFDPVSCLLLRNRGVVTGISGNHKEAVKLLETALPVARAVSRLYPGFYCDYLNSLAVEYSECGRLAEAQAAITRALASPYAAAFPEWRETSDEIAQKLRRASSSLISFTRQPAEANNVMELSALSYDYDATIATLRGGQAIRPARILSFQRWKSDKMAKKTDGAWDALSQQQLKQLTMAEKQAMLLKLIYDDDVTEEMLDKLLEAARGIESSCKDKS